MPIIPPTQKAVLQHGHVLVPLNQYSHNMLEDCIDFYENCYQMLFSSVDVINLLFFIHFQNLLKELY